MSECLRAEWYDLPAEEAADFLGWLHGAHLPALQALPGIVWVGHYRIVHKSSPLDVPGSPARVETDDPVVPKGGDYVLITAALSPDVFFAPNDALDVFEGAAAGQLAKRRQHRMAVFIEELRFDGPEGRRHMPVAGPPPAMQIGSYNVREPADELELARTYRRRKFLEVAATPGMIRTRKLLSVAGWAKHGIFYEFTDLKDAEETFEKRFSADGRRQPASGRHMLEYVVHSPGAPHAGRRIWPAVREI